LQHRLDLRAKRLQAGPQHLAALVERHGSYALQLIEVRWKSWLGQGGQLDDGGMHLGGGRKGFGRQRHHDPRLAAILRQKRQPTVMLGAGFCHDALGDFLLEHQRQRGPERRPGGRGQPADQKLGSYVVGQVGHDLHRRRQMRGQVDVQRIAVQYC